MSNSELAEHFGLSQSFFYALRRTNKEKFNFMFSFDTNRVNSCNKYLTYVENLFIWFQDRLYDREFRTKLGEILIKDNYLPNVPSNGYRVISIEESVFLVRDNYFRVNYSFIKRLEKCKKLLEN